MAVHMDPLQFGNGQGRVFLMTARDGLAAQAGHDLTIEVGKWSAELEVADDHTAAGLTVWVDMNSLVVRKGTGGVKPLTDRDRREIAVSARKVLRAGQNPLAIFRAPDFRPEPGGGGALRGSLTLAGTTRPLWLEVARTGPASYHATGSVRQSDFGIKPYTAFLGALKVSDAVGISIDVELPDGGLDGASDRDRHGEPS
jgi:polyisoprenoid-binding protein YceI